MNYKDLPNTPLSNLGQALDWAFALQYWNLSRQHEARAFALYDLYVHMVLRDGGGLRPDPSDWRVLVGR